jgi:hypothetical protein
MRKLYVEAEGTGYEPLGTNSTYFEASDEDILAHPVVVEALEKAKIEATDILEILGETAWGVQLPQMFVSGPAMKPDGTIGTNPIPTVIHPESAKQLVEHVYTRLSKGRGWLRQEREKVQELRRRLGWALDKLDECGRQVAFTLGMVRSMADCRDYLDRTR